MMYHISSTLIIDIITVVYALLLRKIGANLIPIFIFIVGQCFTWKF